MKYFVYFEDLYSFCIFAIYVRTPLNTKIIILINFILLSSNTFNLDQPKTLLLGKELTLLQTSPGFHVFYKSFENTVRKEEIACNEQFFFSQSVFYLFGDLFAILIKSEVVLCKLFGYGRV